MEDRNIRFAVLATDAVVFGMQKDKLMVLLVRPSRKELMNKWATPGGLVEPDEKLKDAVKSQLKGLLTEEGRSYVGQLKTFGDPGRDSDGRVVSVGHIVLLPFDEVNVSSSERFEVVTWFPVSNLPEMAYDGKKMVKAGLEYLKMRLEYTDLVRYLVPGEFTLTELQEVFEVVLKKKFDKRNFRKKIDGLGWLVELGKKKRVGAYRPAEMYRFKKEEKKV